MNFLDFSMHKAIILLQIPSHFSGVTHCALENVSIISSFIYIYICFIVNLLFPFKFYTFLILNNCWSNDFRYSNNIPEIYQYIIYIIIDRWIHFIFQWLTSHLLIFTIVSIKTFQWSIFNWYISLNVSHGTTLKILFNSNIVNK